MVVEDVVSVLPSQVFDRIESLTVIFKALSIAVIVYVIYLIVVGIFSYLRMKKMRFIEKKVVEIDKKLSKLLRKKKK